MCTFCSWEVSHLFLCHGCATAACPQTLWVSGASQNLLSCVAGTGGTVRGVGGVGGRGGVLTWLGAARVSTDCRMWQERREGSAALPQGLAQNATPKCNTDRGSWSSQLCTCSAQDSDKFKRLLSSYVICLRLSQVPSLWFFLQGAPQGEGTFASNVSLNPPTQTPTAPWDWQKEKKNMDCIQTWENASSLPPLCVLYRMWHDSAVLLSKSPRS